MGTRVSILILLCSLAGCRTTQPAHAPSAKQVDLSRYAPDADWCFVLLDTRTNESTRHNPPRCESRFSPCSTFKIPHALFALHESVLRDEREVLQWDGVERDRTELNHDHNLRSAIRVSVVWFFQEIARRLGAEREQRLLDSIDYGNRDISGGLTEFWLNSSLKISAEEQVRFLDRLRRDDLPLAKRAMAIVRGCIEQDGGAEVRYFGKTGSARGNGGPDLGWWVGWVERGGRAYVFALNISGEKTFGPQARELAERILREMQVLPPAAAQGPAQ